MLLCQIQRFLSILHTNLLFVEHLDVCVFLITGEHSLPSPCYTCTSKLNRITCPGELWEWSWPCFCSCCLPPSKAVLWACRYEVMQGPSLFQPLVASMEGGGEQGRFCCTIPYLMSPWWSSGRIWAKSACSQRIYNQIIKPRLTSGHFPECEQKLVDSTINWTHPPETLPANLPKPLPVETNLPLQVL